MSTLTVHKAAGLHTTENQTTLPPGAVKTADNVVVRSKDLYEPRRGQKQETNAAETTNYTFGSGTSRAKAFYFFNGGKVVQYDTSNLAYNTTAAYTDIAGTYTPPDAATLRMKFAEAAQHLLFTSTAGTQVMETLTSVPRAAGVARALDILPEYVGGSMSGLTGVPNYTPAAGLPGAAWLPQNSQVAYRLAYGKKDTNNVVRYGVPSGRFTVINPAPVVQAIGSLTKAVGIVTCAASLGHGFNVNDFVAITPGEANYAAGTFLITAVTATSYTYDDGTGATTAASTVAQTVSSGLKRVKLRITPPVGIDNTYFYQIFRSDPSPTASTDPGDELFLIYEGVAPNVPGVFFFTDSTPTGFYGAPLYTNPQTGDGLNQANFPPPLAKDVAVWQERTWYANTRSKQRLNIQLLGVGTPDGIQSGDVVFLGGVAGGMVAGGDFAVTTTSTPSINITKAAQLLSGTFSVNTRITGIAAYYASGVNDPPGKIGLEEAGTTVGSSAFYVGSTRATAFSPPLPTVLSMAIGGFVRTGGNLVTVTTSAAHGLTTGASVYLTDAGIVDAAFDSGVFTITVTSATTFTYTQSGANGASAVAHYGVPATVPTDPDTAPNRIFYSKLQQPEAVPLLNYLDVGSKSSAILRIIPMGLRLFVLKEDAIYTISGAGDTFRVDLLDNTVRLLAPDSAVSVNGKIFALTNQGVVSISESGVAIVSRPIDADLAATFFRGIGAGNASMSTLVWGAAYNSEHLYLLGTASDPTDTTAQVIYVYNVLTGCWTKWLTPRRFASVDPATDKLWLSSDTSNNLLVERKRFNYSDYADSSFPVTVTAVDTTAKTVTLSSAVGVSVGDVIGASISAGVLIIAINGNVLTYTGYPASSQGDFTATVPLAGTNYIFTGYQVTLEYAPQYSGEPGTTKQNKEATLHCNCLNLFHANATFRTEWNTSTANASFTTPTYALGATPTEYINTRFVVPLEKQRGTLCRVGLSAREAFARWQLAGYSLDVDGLSQRNTR